jgi:transposase
MRSDIKVARKSERRYKWELRLKFDRDWSGEKEFLMLKKKASARRSTRRTHKRAFKARVALAALREDRTPASCASSSSCTPNQITEWKRQVLEHAAEVFEGATPPTPVNPAAVHAKIGQLKLQNYFLERALTKPELLSEKP